MIAYPSGRGPILVLHNMMNVATNVFSVASPFILYNISIREKALCSLKKQHTCYLPSYH